MHGFLGRVPMMATFLLTVLHWDQARAAIGLRGRPDWRLKPKRRPGDTFVKLDGALVFAERNLYVDWIEPKPSHP